jgi:hypothetical protein
MRRLIALAVGGLLSVSLAAVVSAAPAATSSQPKSSLGITNARKAMQGKLERDKKIREVQKKGQAKRRQAQLG